MKQFRIHKDDKVMVIAGKDEGKIGKVLKVLRKSDRILVEKVNVVKRNVRPNPYKREAGGIVEKEAAIYASKVMLVCPSCKKATRAAHKFVQAENGKSVKQRVCRKCGASIDN